MTLDDIAQVQQYYVDAARGFTNRYGDWIMLEPPKRGLHLVVWVLPVVAGLAGLAVVALLVRRWLATARQPIVVGQEALDRVRAELESGEG